MFHLDVEEKTSTLLFFDIIDLDKIFNRNYENPLTGRELQYMKKFNNYISNLCVLERAEQEDLENAFIVSGIIDKLYGENLEKIDSMDF